MSISYQPKDSALQGLQLSVQELVVKKSDKQVVSTSLLTATVDLKQPIKEIRAAMFCNDSAPAVELVAQADINLSVANKVTLTLSEALADEDSIIIKYIIQE